MYDTLNMQYTQAEHAVYTLNLEYNITVTLSVYF